MSASREINCPPTGKSTCPLTFHGPSQQNLREHHVSRVHLVGTHLTITGIVHRAVVATRFGSPGASGPRQTACRVRAAVVPRLRRRPDKTVDGVGSPTPDTGRCAPVFPGSSRPPGGRQAAAHGKGLRSGNCGTFVPGTPVDWRRPYRCVDPRWPSRSFDHGHGVHGPESPFVPGMRRVGASEAGPGGPRRRPGPLDRH